MDKDDDGGGYGKPPKKHQFKKGKSGNPAGRPKGSGSVSALMRKGLDRAVVVRKGGVETRMSYRKAFVDKVLKDAFEGDAKARALVLQIDHQDPAHDERRKAAQSARAIEEERAIREEVLSYMSGEMLDVLLFMSRIQCAIEENLPRLRELRQQEEQEDAGEAVWRLNQRREGPA